jgi:hypothetical protein
VTSVKIYDKDVVYEEKSFFDFAEEDKALQNAIATAILVIASYFVITKILKKDGLIVLGITGAIAGGIVYLLNKQKTT